MQRCFATFTHERCTAEPDFPAIARNSNAKQRKARRDMRVLDALHVTSRTIQSKPSVVTCWNLQKRTFRRSETKKGNMMDRQKNISHETSSQFGTLTQSAMTPFAASRFTCHTTILSLYTPRWPLPTPRNHTPHFTHYSPHYTPHKTRRSTTLY